MTTEEKEAQSAPKLQLKLLLDQHSNRVLFAEAGKEAVDFLLGLLKIPLGLVVHLLAGEQVPGSLSSIYSSIQNLDESYFILPNRDTLLKPRLPSVSLPLLEVDPPAPSMPPPKKYYRCPGTSGICRGNPLILTDTLGVGCPNCRHAMMIEMRIIEKPKTDEGEPGYVKGLITYLVMDDLSVMPMSTISAISLIKKFELKDLSALCEMTVEFGMKEVADWFGIAEGFTAIGNCVDRCVHFEATGGYRSIADNMKIRTPATISESAVPGMALSIEHDI